MSLAIVYSRASIAGSPFSHDYVHISNGNPKMTIVGLPETTVKEAADRVRSALINANFFSIRLNALPSTLHLLIYRKRAGVSICRLPLVFLLHQGRLIQTYLNALNF